MPADVSQVTEAMRTRLQDLVARCGQRGITMRPSTGLRDPFEQGRLWRQSRSSEEITAMVKELESKAAPFLAHCISSVGPQNGKHVTDTPPGISWHQWGEAVDCFWLLDGKAEWSTTKKVNGLNGYQVYADEAEAVGLTAGGHWTSFKDWPHVQLRKATNALKIMSLSDIDAEMRKRFGA